MAATITLGSKVTAGQFNYYPDKSTSFAVRYLYPRDINGDGTDEIVFAGFETSGSGSYSNTNMEIYGWVNGQLQSITGQWLPNGINQVQGVGDIGFGDFNKDGKVDMFLSAYTDSDVSAHMYALVNRGNYYERVDFGSAVWQHAVAVGDINRDGYDDVYIPNYPTTMVLWGSTNGLVKSNTTGAYGGGMGAALGDFLGNGTMSVIVSDNDASSSRDISLYSITVSNASTGLIGSSDGTALGVVTPTAELTKVSTLPQPLLVDLANNIKSHDVRVKAMDFNNDNKLDVVVFSRASVATGWPELSRIQFYKNTGGGNFEDVTSTFLSGYRVNSNVSYSPVFGDFNNDGKLDIFSSDSSFGSSHASTTMLIQQSDGTFADTARSILSSLIEPNGGIATVAKGPDGNFYIVTETDSTAGSNGFSATIASYLLQWTAVATGAPTGLVGSSDGASVIVTPPVATYALSASASSVNEGSDAVFTLTTTNVASGTLIAYTITGVSSSDVTGGTLSGTTTIGSNGLATISIPTVADQTTEGNETVTVTAQGQSASTTISDTSTTPVPTYAISANSSTVDEGANAVFILTTTNVASGTAINYTLSGISASDVTNGVLIGTATVGSNGQTTISIPIASDLITEGMESITVTAQSISASMTISDTSITPVIVTPSGGGGGGGGGGGSTVVTTAGGSSTTTKVSTVVIDTTPVLVNSPLPVLPVTGFSNGIDRIVLDHNIFTKFTVGQTVSSNITYGINTQLPNSYIVYDNGTLYYDTDGAGGQTPIVLVTLPGMPTLTAGHIVIG